MNQRTLSHVAIAYDWTRAEINNGKIGKRVVPDRQRKYLAAALRDVLEDVLIVWSKSDYGVSIFDANVGEHNPISVR